MSTPRRGSARSGEIPTLLICAALLSGVAIYNRYPLVWPDTGGYLRPINIIFRSIFYSFFVYPSRMVGTLWPVVYLQSLLVAYLLRLGLREVFGITSRSNFLVIIILLCVLTSLPWYTGFLMPDIFTPVLVLGLFLLAFCVQGLSQWERIYIVALTFLAAVVHYSHVPIAIGLLATGLVARVIIGKWAPDRVPHLMLPAAIVAASTIAIIVSNYLTLGLVTFSVGGYAFELARLQADGQAVEYLRDNCGKRSYKLCEYVYRMPMEDWRFLWSDTGPMRQLGWLQERKEGTEIIWGTIEEYPLWTLQSAIANTFSQVTMFETAARVISFTDAPYPTRDLEAVYPADFAAYQDSRQARGELANLYGLKRLDTEVVILSFVYCLLIAGLFAKDGQWLPIELIATIAVSLVLNGFVSGALSQPDNRYGSRLIWLVPMVAISSWRKALRLRETGPGNS